ncbi:MAG: glycosyltransferase family 9 protein, partial [Bacteroidota bacterium]
MNLQSEARQSSGISASHLRGADDGYGRVYVVHSFEEAQRALASTEAKNFKNLLLIALNKTWALVVTFLLKLLALVFFSKRKFKNNLPKHIVVYTVGVLGDNAIRLGALAALRYKYPKARITVTVATGSGSSLPAQLYGKLPCIDDCVIFDQEFLEGTRCDLFVDLSGSANLGLFRLIVREMLYAYKMKATYAIGFYVSTYGIRKLLNPVQHHFIENEPRRYLRVLREIDLNPIMISGVLPENKKIKESLTLKHGIKNGEMVVVMAPGAGKQAKVWPSERFATTAVWLKERYRARVFLVGDASEKEIAEKVTLLSENSVVNIAGETTIQELIELLRIAKICITNDTGTMHVAAVLQVPTVA